MRATLPEKWKLKVNYENFKILGDWRYAGPIGLMDYNKNDPSGYITDKEGYWELYPSKDREEITFEEFRVLVLGEEPNNVEPIYEIY